jgi:hypothetical protein
MELIIGYSASISEGTTAFKPFGLARIAGKRLKKYKAKALYFFSRQGGRETGQFSDDIALQEAWCRFYRGDILFLISRCPVIDQRPAFEPFGLLPATRAAVSKNAKRKISFFLTAKAGPPEYPKQPPESTPPSLQNPESILSLRTLDIRTKNNLL